MPCGNVFWKIWFRLTPMQIYIFNKWQDTIVVCIYHFTVYIFQIYLKLWISIRIIFIKVMMTYKQGWWDVCIFSSQFTISLNIRPEKKNLVSISAVAWNKTWIFVVNGSMNTERVFNTKWTNIYPDLFQLQFEQTVE